MAEVGNWNWQKIRERLQYDSEQIAAKQHTADRLREFADNEEREASLMEWMRSNFVDLLLKKAAGTPDYHEIESLLKEFGVMLVPATGEAAE